MQKYKVTITFEIEPEVFPGDPDDVYDLARLEKDYLDNSLKVIHESTTSVPMITVQPIIGE